MRQLFFLCIMLTSAFGQISLVPYEIGPAFRNNQLLYSYRGTFSSIRKIDFRNFSFRAFDDNGKSIPQYAGERVEIHLRNGHYKHQEPGDYEALDLDSVYFLPKSPSSDGDSALILLSWSAAGGSSSQWGTGQVFRLAGSQLQVVQEIEWETHGVEKLPTQSFDPGTNTLVVRSDHYLPGDGHCCVSALDLVTFKWDGDRFVQTGIRTELSKYGMREGKKLPTISAR